MAPKLTLETLDEGDESAALSPAAVGVKVNGNGKKDASDVAGSKEAFKAVGQVLSMVEEEHEDDLKSLASRKTDATSGKRQDKDQAGNGKSGAKMSRQASTRTSSYVRCWYFFKLKKSSR